MQPIRGLDRAQTAALLISERQNAMTNSAAADRMHGMAAFTGTDLDALLRGFGVETIVLSGISTNIAPPGAATEAVALGYNVVLAEDCTAGGTPESHEAQLGLHLPLLATISDSRAIAESLTAMRQAAAV